MNGKSVHATLKMSQKKDPNSKAAEAEKRIED
jgi:hypothetical protein